MKLLGIRNLFLFSHRCFAMVVCSSIGVHATTASILSAIGFTRSFFISTLAFKEQSEVIEHAKLRILLGSIIADILSIIVLLFSSNKAANNAVLAKDGRSIASALSFISYKS
ncbi:MAG: Na+/H+ antiporter NhaA [Kangiellaceae bacterium]|jgi:Na+/H+ antiporter NhaA